MRKPTRRFTIRPARPPAMHARAAAPVHMEVLEPRRLLSAGSAQPAVDLAPGPVAALNCGFDPAQIRQRYGFDAVRFGDVAGDGSGQTIAIVDAYGDPNISADLATFDAKFGLAAPPSFKVLNQNGGGTLPAVDPAWAMETSLDVEWAHAIAPGANIVLVQSESSNLDDLLSGVNTARSLPNVSVVSMSWGGGEFPLQISEDGLFTTPANHNGITFVAASGDGGRLQGPDWPATSPNVLGVGGTSLSGDSGAESEVGWAGSGGGASHFESVPSYQSGVAEGNTRLSPDVAFNADPGTGYAVYDSVPDNGQSGWTTVGGTSAAAPQWAGLIAVVDQGRSLNALGSLDGATQTIPSLYAMSAQSGGAAPFFSSDVGYDTVVGLGSPRPSVIVANFTDTSRVVTVISLPQANDSRGRKAHPQVVVEGAIPPPAISPNAVPAGAAASLPLTPLAQVPARIASVNSGVAPPAQSPLELTTVTPIGQLAPTPHLPGGTTPGIASIQYAASVPPGLISELVPPAVVDGVAGAVAHVAGALQGAVSGEIVGAEAVYNFVTFNPAAMLTDTIAAVANDFTSLSGSDGASMQESARLAWTVTAAVVGVDVLVAGCWIRKSRRESAARRKQITGWMRLANPRGLPV